MHIAVLGTGYVGLVSAACLAELGHSVMAVDIDPQRIELLNRGGMPLYEPELAPLVAVHRATGQLGFTVDLSLALRKADVVMIAIGTPAGRGGQADVNAVMQAGHAIGQLLEQPATVVMKSTVPVGTCERVRAVVRGQLRARGKTFNAPVVSNPEFLREGCAVQDFLRPDRIIVGASYRAEAELMHAMYAPLVQQDVPLLLMDTRSAEMSKYAANAMLAARISLINELANLAEALGADIEQVRLGVGSDRRVGPQFLHAGIGFGGSCFPKDVKALSQMSTEVGLAPHMLDAIDRVNEAQKRRLFEKIAAFYGGTERLRGKRLAVWGLAFKPGTDDMREAPSLVLIRQLVAAGATVQAYDPVAGARAAALLRGLGGVKLCASAAESLRHADALALATEWDEFLRADPAEAAAHLADGVVFDGRNALDVRRWSRHGLRLLQVGRPGGTMHAVPETMSGSTQQ